MAVTEKHVTRMMSVLRASKPPEDFERARRVDQAIDEQGKVILRIDFLELPSPDGSRWRFRVDNTGTLGPGVKVTS